MIAFPKIIKPPQVLLSTAVKSEESLISSNSFVKIMGLAAVPSALILAPLVMIRAEVKSTPLDGMIAPLTTVPGSIVKQAPSSTYT